MDLIQSEAILRLPNIPIFSSLDNMDNMRPKPRQSDIIKPNVKHITQIDKLFYTELMRKKLLSSFVVYVVRVKRMSLEFCQPQTTSYCFKCMAGSGNLSSRTRYAVASATTVSNLSLSGACRYSTTPEFKSYLAVFGWKAAALVCMLCRVNEGSLPCNSPDT